MWLPVRLVRVVEELICLRVTYSHSSPSTVRTHLQPLRSLQIVATDVLALASPIEPRRDLLIHMLQADAISDLHTKDMKQVLDFAKTGPDAQQVLVLGQAIQASFIEFSLSQTELGWHLLGAVVLQLVRHLSRLLTIAIPTGDRDGYDDYDITWDHLPSLFDVFVGTMRTHTHFAILRILQFCVLGLSQRAPIMQVPCARLSQHVLM